MKNPSEHVNEVEAETKPDASVSSSSPSHAEAVAAEKAYWLSRTPQERVRHMEILRRLKYGARSTQRIQRVFKIVKRSDS